MVSVAMAIQLLSSSLCSSWLGGMADSWEASSKGGMNRGRLAVMSLCLLLSTIAILLHSLPSLWNHWYWSETQQVDANYSYNNLDMDGVGTAIDHYPSNVPITRPLLVYHLFLRALFAMGTSGINIVCDGLTLSQLDQEGRDKHEYGKERVYGAVSWGIASIMFGPVIDLFGFKTLYTSTILSSGGCMITFSIYARSTSADAYVKVSAKETVNDIADEKKLPDEEQNDAAFGGNNFLDNGADGGTNKERNHDFLTLSHIVQYISQRSPTLNASYIISLFTLYIGMSVVESLVFLYFELLGGSNTMCGLTVAVTVLFELPLFHYAPEMLKLLGTIPMFQWGCLAYVVRVLGYSVVPKSHPYWVLLLEPLHGITIAFALTSSVAVADRWMPRGSEASGQGLLLMVRSFGQFVGFCLASVLEGRTLYRALAAVVAVGMLILGMGNYFSATKQAKYTSIL